MIAGLIVVGLSGGANAADSRIYGPADFVPGTPAYWNWSGYYVGGHWGYSSATVDPGNATNSLVAHILRFTTLENEAVVSQWSQLRKSSETGQSGGAFAGYNSQWEDVILGLEFQYNFADHTVGTFDTIGRSFAASDGYRYNTTVWSRANVTLKDYASFRGRAGYAMGAFLPYAQLGFVVGRADVFRQARVRTNGVDNDPIVPPPLPPVGLDITETERKNDVFVYGLSAGVGLDVALTPAIFARAEYEYIQIFQFHGITAQVNTGRLGLGVKF
jgi:opacity protein-like surface antigen